MGFLGLGLYIALMVISMRYNRKNRARLESIGQKKTWLYNYLLAIDLGLIGYMVSGCFITSTYYPHLYFFALFARTCDLLVDKKVEDAQLADATEEIDQSESAPSVEPASLGFGGARL
jgi:hypothetical protein